MDKITAPLWATWLLLLAVGGGCVATDGTAGEPDGASPPADARADGGSGADAAPDAPADIGGPDADAPADVGDAAMEVQPQTVITFLRWDVPDQAAADDEFLAAYTAANPSVRFEVTTLRYPTLTQYLLTELTRDQLAFDLVRMPPAWVCGFAGNLQDVPPAVVTVSEAQDRFFAAPLAGSICEGQLKGLPLEYNLEYGGVVINLTRYQVKFGIGIQPVWNTWAQFIEEAAQLSEYDGDLPMANGLDIDPSWPQPVKHLFLAQILQRGGKYWEGAGDVFDASQGHTFDFTSEEATDALTEMVSWVATEKVMFPEIIPPVNTFVTVRLVSGATGYGWSDPGKPLSMMGYAGPWALARALAQRLSGDTSVYAYHPLPPMAGTEHRFVQNSGAALVVPKTSPNAAVAWAVAKALALSPEAMRTWAATGGTLPALKVNGTRGAAAGDPLLARVQPLLEAGRWVGYIPPAAIETIEGTLLSNYFAAVQGTAGGGKTIEQALLDMETAANAALAIHR
jgi:multiple sugar transport system substrate-binding protein